MGCMGLAGVQHGGDDISWLLVFQQGDVMHATAITAT